MSHVTCAKERSTSSFQSTQQQLEIQFLQTQGIKQNDQMFGYNSNPDTINLEVDSVLVVHIYISI